MIINNYDKKRYFNISLFLMIMTSLLLLSVLGYSIYLYSYIIKTKTDQFSQSENRVLNETRIVKISQIERFNGEQSYHIVYGENNQNEAKIAFVPLDSDENISIVDQKRIISKEEIEKQIYSQCNTCEIHKITPAIFDEQYLWEVKYKKENHLIFDYLSLENGEIFERLTLTDTYN